MSSGSPPPRLDGGVTLQRADRRRPYGVLRPAVAAARARFDPAGILAPGRGIRVS